MDLNIKTNPYFKRVVIVYEITLPFSSNSSVLDNANCQIKYSSLTWQLSGRGVRAA
ncbi:hypothetical protein [Candidatus Rickettsiella isopodorum]|uniref:hypothetical protein n=1 Tax=Candidatus Rickettsiella isopodorum TaxID=1225476 RepID=UPI001C0D205C|nr:hypothetical protein [Candidatus Rickettsiella isopodorum]